MKKINWKSKKTIAVILILAIVLLALLITGIVFAVKHSRAESLPAAVPGTTAESLTTEPAETATGSGEPTAAATPAVSATAAGASAAANNDSSDKSSKPAGGSSGTNSKPSGTASGSNTTPSGGSGGTNAKPSGGSTAKPTTKPVTTTKPAKKEFAMTKQEIIDYASDYIEDTYGCTYYDGFGKNVPGTGFNAPFEFERGDSAEYIKERLRGRADATYIKNGWYKVYVEMEDEDTMRVYLFY